MEKRLEFLTVETDVGGFSVLLENGQLAGCGFDVRGDFPAHARLSPVAEKLRQSLVRYFREGKWDFDRVKLPVSRVSPIARKVYDYLRVRVGPGTTISYRDLGMACGTGPRAVASLMAHNPWAVIVPCHRVIGSDGSLGGYAGGVRIKEWLLCKEGVKVRPGR